ncbi:MAG: glutaconyl-CoA decarboxylase beta subunit, partial [uncultured bacterium]
MLETLMNFAKSTGFGSLTPGMILMIGIACLLLYLAIVKKFEPLLLVPIAFGVLLTNLPLAGMMSEPVLEIKNNIIHTVTPGGLLYYLFQGDHLGIFPPLIFMGVGAMTDFGPLIANPKSLLLGAAAQFGIFITFMGAIFSGLFTAQEAASIGIIGGADGP